MVTIGAVVLAAVAQAPGSVWGHIGAPPGQTVYCVPDTAATRSFVAGLARQASQQPQNFRNPAPPAAAAVAKTDVEGDFHCNGLAAGSYVVYSHLFGDAFNVRPTTTIFGGTGTSTVTSGERPVVGERLTQRHYNAVIAGTVHVPSGKNVRTFFRLVNGSSTFAPVLH